MADIHALLARPVRLPSGSRRYTHTTLYGQLLMRKGVRLYQAAAVSGVNEKQLSDFLGRKRKVSKRGRMLMARYIGLPPEDFIDPDGFLTLAPAEYLNDAEDEDNGDEAATG